MAFSHNAKITIDHTKVPNTDQTNFPVLISGTYAGVSTDPDLRVAGSGGGVQSSSGFDIYFYSDAALTTRLAAERVVWTSTTGKIEAWVKIPTLSHTTDTVIYIAYGDATISTDPNSDATYGKTSVWTNSYVGVYHLPDGTTLNTNDSTSNAYNTTNHSATAVAGQVDGGASFNGTSAYLSASTSTDTGLKMGTHDWTISGWIKSTVNGADQGITGVWEASGAYWYFKKDATNALGLRMFDGGSIFFTVLSTGTITDSSWHHVAVAATRSGNAAFFIDGVASGTPSISSLNGTNLNPSSEFNIGNIGTHNGSSYFTGSIDQLGIANVARSGDWIATEYNNQSSPSTFYTIAAGTIYNDSPSGTITLSGTNPDNWTSSISVAGTITLSGTRSEAWTHADSFSGTITLSGSRTELCIASVSPSGTITLGGSSTENFIHRVLPVGTITLSGTLIINYVEFRLMTHTGLSRLNNIEQWLSDNTHFVRAEEQDSYTGLSREATVVTWLKENPLNGVTFSDYVHAGTDEFWAVEDYLLRVTNSGG